MTTQDDSRWLIDGPDRGTATLILAHGAGAPMDSPFMTAMAEGLSRREIRVVRFEFPYMAGRREHGKRRPPDRTDVLLESWNETIERWRSERLVIGGKSLGGRIASMVADDQGVAGLVCLGYPFHPPGKPDKLRTEHLRTLTTPTLIAQGERDTLGSRDEVSRYELSRSIRLCWLTDGDHSFKPRKSSGVTERENWDRAIAETAEFVQGLTA